MDAATRRFVVQRAANCCEYCHLPQTAAPLALFHLEHIQAQQHIHDDSLDNLALACPDCNRYKGPNLTSLDPATREIVVLFNPRLHHWEDHFALQGPTIVGRTPTGVATVRLLQMNSSRRVERRRELIEFGEF